MTKLLNMSTINYKVILFLCLILSRLTLLNSQNANLIPNYSFEIGQGTKTPGCVNYYSGLNVPVCRFDNDVDSWRIAKMNASCGCYSSGSCGSPDWTDLTTCGMNEDWGIFHYDNSIGGGLINTPSNRCVRIGSIFGDNYKEGIRVGLIGDDGNTYNLKSNKTYTLRIKLANLEKHSNLRIHAAKYGEHWNATSGGNVKQSDIGGIDMTDAIYNDNKFYSFQLTLSKIDDDKDNVLSNIIFVCEGGTFLIDEVELYERSCEQDLYIENTIYTFNKEAPFEAQNIIAGYEVANPPFGSGNVIVKNGADVTYKGVHSVQLKSGFSVESGGKFLAYIAPCGRTCPYFPIIDAGADATICSNNTYQLGIPSDNHFQYTWTAEPPTAIAYLSSAYISNPVFTPPTNSCGTVKYTLTVSCDNESQSDNVIINYNTTQTATSSVNASITSNQDDCNLSLNIEVAECTEKVEIEVWDWSQTNKLYSHELHAGVDFTCCNFNWTMPDILTKCNNYKVKVIAKTICNPQVSYVILDWLRNSIITVVAPNVFTPNDDGIGDEFCFTVTGAETYTIYIQNPATGVVHQGSGTVCGPNICVWDGGTYEFGTFFYVATFDNDCQNEVSINGTVNILTNKNYIIPDSNENSSPTEYLSETNTQSITIHPNPAKNVLFIEGLTYPSIVTIYDLTGKQMFSTQINGHQLDISSLEKGMYFLKLTTAEGLVIKKFVRE